MKIINEKKMRKRRTTKTELLQQTAVGATKKEPPLFLFMSLNG